MGESKLHIRQNLNTKVIFHKFIYGLVDYVIKGLLVNVQYYKNKYGVCYY